MCPPLGNFCFSAGADGAWNVIIVRLMFCIFHTQSHTIPAVTFLKLCQHQSCSIIIVTVKLNDGGIGCKSPTLIIHISSTLGLS